MTTNRNSRPMWAARGIGASALLSLLVGCPGTDPTDMMADMMQPAPTGAELFALITQGDPYQQWEQFPGLEGTIASAAPHGPMARVFINDRVEAALTNFSGELPNGAIIVKENLGASTSDKAEALTIMWKVSGFDADNNDWFWAMITPDGQVNAEGPIVSCRGCHSAARGNDYVFLHQF